MQRTGRPARADDGALGHAWAAAARWRARDEHQKHQEPALARLLKPANRCVVPWTSFCEYADTKPKKTPTWFAFDETRPLAVFAGVWAMWTGRRGTKANPVEGQHTLFGFLTCEPNDVVGAVHPKAMPVILTPDDEIERWMSAPAEDALKLQRPLPDRMLKVVATGEWEDGASVAA